MTLKAVLFDVDGILLDSSRAIVSAYTESLQKLGVDAPSAKEILAHEGLSAHAWVDAMVPHVPAEVRQAVADRVQQHYAHFVEDFAKPNAGALTLAQKLKKKGFKIGVVTNNSKAEVLKVITKLPLVFDSLTFATPGRLPKPAPDLILDALSALNVKAADAVLLGDTPADYYAAKAAGVRPLLRLTERTATLDAAKFARFSDAYEQLTNA